MTRLNLAFMGAAAFAVPALDALVEAGHDIVAVYSQPPRPAGRGRKERRTPVHDRALELGLDVRTPLSLRDEVEQAAGIEQDGNKLRRQLLERPAPAIM